MSSKQSRLEGVWFSEKEETEFSFEGKDFQIPDGKGTLLSAIDYEESARHTYFSYYDTDGEPAEEPVDDDNDSLIFSFEK